MPATYRRSRGFGRSIASTARALRPSRRCLPSASSLPTASVVLAATFVCIILAAIIVISALPAILGRGSDSPATNTTLCAAGVDIDVCGRCGGDGTSCWGCDNVPNSGAVDDVCGTCSGSVTTCRGCGGPLVAVSGTTLAVLDASGWLYTAGRDSAAPLTKQASAGPYAELYSTAGSFVAVRRTDGVIETFGVDTYGELGRGYAPAASWRAPAVTSPALSVSYTACGARHCCLSTAIGRTIMCWGDNALGQLGLPAATTTSNVPVSNGLIGTFMAATDGTTCAYITPDALIKCWGDNTYGVVVPTAPSAGLATAAFISGIPAAGAVMLAGLGRTMLAVRANATSVYAWGDNADGQLGVGDRVAHTGVQLVALGESTGGTVVYAPSSHRDATCLGLSNATSVCIGTGALGVRGDGAADALASWTTVAAAAGSWWAFGPTTARGLPIGARLDALTTSVSVWGDVETFGKTSPAYTLTPVALAMTSLRRCPRSS